MKVKIDTKQKFTVITPQEQYLHANIAEELYEKAALYLDADPRNIVLNLNEVNQMENSAAYNLASLQQRFYDNHASFVICGVQPPVEKLFEEQDLLEFLNITPTESEAWDMVQMEEVERELLDNDDN